MQEASCVPLHSEVAKLSNHPARAIPNTLFARPHSITMLSCAWKVGMEPAGTFEFHA